MQDSLNILLQETSEPEHFDNMTNLHNIQMHNMMF